MATNSDQILKANKCVECGNSFSSLSNLRRHIKQFHPDKFQVAPQIYKNKANFKFSCDECGRNFNYRHHLKFHKKKTHISSTSVEILETTTEKIITRYTRKCPMCSFTSSSVENLLEHFQQIHEISISCKEMEFSSIDDCNQWIKQIEKETHSRFIKKHTSASKTQQTTIYSCHRSGFYVPEGKGLRNLKIKGSVKINGYCPAKIRLIKQSDGKCQVQFTESHVGHSLEEDLDYLYLTKEERQHLAMKIASKVSFEDILDEVRDSVSNDDLERIHLLKRKDLYNIERCFNLPSKSVKHFNRHWDERATEVHHQNDHLYLHGGSQSTADGSKTIIQELNYSKKEISLDERKEKIILWFQNLMEEIQSPIKLDAVEKFMAPLPPTLAAVENLKCQSSPMSSRKGPHHKKIEAQRRLWSTKKKRNKSKTAIKKPISQTTCRR